MSDPFVGGIRMFGGTFAPKGWALANGQLLSINQNQALFSLLGTFYGGNGSSTFALPSLQGRMPMHAGQGPGLSARALGSYGGVEYVTQQTTQVPGAPVSPIQAVLGFQQQVPIMSPFAVVNFIIALQGVFPARP
jgi:microcystin-dependent protein